MVLGRLPGIALLSLVAWSFTAGAQARSPTTPIQRRLTIKVVDAAGIKLGNARVALADSELGRTDSTGELILHVAAQPLHLSVRRLGFESTDDVAVGAADSLIVVPLSLQPLLIDSVRVFAVSPMFAEFEQRRALGLGVYITPDAISKSKATRPTDLFRQISQVQVVQTNTGPGVRFTTSNTSISRVANVTFGISADMCAPMIYLDGQRAPSLELDDINMADILAIEVYRGGAITPPQFTTPGVIQCGAIVIWTRRR